MLCNAWQWDIKVFFKTCFAAKWSEQLACAKYRSRCVHITYGRLIRNTTAIHENLSLLDPNLVEAESRQKKNKDKK